MDLEIPQSEDEIASGEELVHREIAIQSSKIFYSNKTGICLDCGNSIPEERLEVFPECNCCVKCQGERDAGRPKSPFKLIPLHKMFGSIDRAIEENEEEFNETSEKKKGEYDDKPDVQKMISEVTRDVKAD